MVDVIMFAIDNKLTSDVTLICPPCRLYVRITMFQLSLVIDGNGMKNLATAGSDDTQSWVLESEERANTLRSH